MKWCDLRIFSQFLKKFSSLTLLSNLRKAYVLVKPYVFYHKINFCTKVLSNWLWISTASKMCGPLNLLFTYAWGDDLDDWAIVVSKSREKLPKEGEAIGVHVLIKLKKTLSHIRRKFTPKSQSRKQNHWNLVLSPAMWYPNHLPPTKTSAPLLSFPTTSWKGNLVFVVPMCHCICSLAETPNNSSFTHHALFLRLLVTSLLLNKIKSLSVTCCCF